MIIYPPLIETLIPGFLYNENKVIIKIPFKNNPAIYDENLKLQLMIKDYLTFNVLINTEHQNDFVAVNIDYEKGEAVFEISSFEYSYNSATYEFPTIGQVYKVQIAYTESDNYTSPSQLTFSTASNIKCISNKNEQYINNNDSNDILTNSIDYIGYYKRDKYSDPLYSYRFEFYDETGILLEDSDIQFWNIKDDEEIEEIDENIVKKYYMSNPKFHLNKELEYGKLYIIKFTITTASGYANMVQRNVQKEISIEPLYTFDLQLENNYNDGYVKISFSNLSSEQINGDFVLERSLDKETWLQIDNIQIGIGNDLYQTYWRDFTVEQGKTHYYRIKQYHNNKYSEVISQASINVDFEDMFLSDGKKQIKIRFNPKVSSFKTTLLEQKTDTIGSKYPYFFKNKKVGYKEIPISGLVSYLMDDQNFFISEEELGLIKKDGSKLEKTINLVDYNIAAERIFKLKLLDWLNNGELKLFRSPTEGNYVVRLMNTSLSPNDTVSRMLHTFSCTGYEAAAADQNTLINKELFKLDEHKESTTTFIQGTFNSLTPNQELELTNVKNFKWKTSYLDTSSQAYIILNGDAENKIYNYSGLIELPEDILYNSIKIVDTENNELDTRGSWFSYIILNDEYDESQDTFGDDEYKIKWYSYNNDSTDKEIEINGKINYLQAQSLNTNSYIKFIYSNGSQEQIDISSQPYYIYTDLDSNIKTLEYNNANIILQITEKIQGE